MLSQALFHPGIDFRFPDQANAVPGGGACYVLQLGPRFEHLGADCMVDFPVLAVAQHHALIRVEDNEPFVERLDRLREQLATLLGGGFRPFPDLDFLD